MHAAPNRSGFRTPCATPCRIEQAQPALARTACRIGTLAVPGLRRARLFWHDELGVMTFYTLFLTSLIFMFTGIGIDLMRFERDRAELQYTLDRAVLAAADLDQTQPAETVVRDYLAKAGLEQYLTSVAVDQGLSFRKVSAVAEGTTLTHFMDLLGIETLVAPAASTAEERLGNVEISMVLDMSGSMNSNQRLTRLKPAARDFVDTILNNSEDGKASISIIPFATQVNAGENLLSRFNISQEHDYSHCVDFNANQFKTTELLVSELLERTAHFDPFTYSENPISSPVCPTRTGSEILPLSKNRTTLHNFIDSMSASGNTSIDIGVKWGSALLDPTTQPAIAAMVKDGQIDAAFGARPSAYNDGDTLKVLVVMSDGQNTNQYFLNPSLRDGEFDVWYNAQERKYSVYHSNGNKNYYWPHDNSWNDHPYGAGSGQPKCEWQKKKNKWVQVCTSTDEPGEVVRLTYPELWAQTSLAWNAKYNYEFSNSAWGQWYQSAYSFKNGTAKDQFTKQICSAARDRGIIIFTIGFEAPYAGQQVLENCASSTNHHFDVDGLEIADAFASIASSIRKLRLTQ